MALTRIDRNLYTGLACFVLMQCVVFVCFKIENFSKCCQTKHTVSYEKSNFVLKSEYSSTNSNLTPARNETNIYPTSLARTSQFTGYQAARERNINKQHFDAVEENAKASVKSTRNGVPQKFAPKIVAPVGEGIIEPPWLKQKFPLALNISTSKKKRYADKMHQRKPFDYEPTLNINSTQIAIFVQSAPYHLQLRNGIRRSWGQPVNLRKYNASLRFVIGDYDNSVIRQTIWKETRYFNDVLHIKIKESYKNLSLKTIETLKWAKKYCSDVKYILKQDDDTFVNYEKLIPILKEFEANNITEFIAGDSYHGRTPKREPGNFFYTPKEMWKSRTWPDMAVGPAYVISNNVVSRLIARAAVPSTPFVVWEDVYVTGILRQFENITLLDIPNMRHVKCGTTEDKNQVSYHHVTREQHEQLAATFTCALDENLWFMDPKKNE